jgi:hypothetical protein
VTAAATPTNGFATDLADRAAEWRRLANDLEACARTWTGDATRWPRRGDARRAIAGERVAWVAEQSRQLASWLHMAADHLLALAGTAHRSVP